MGAAQNQGTIIDLDLQHPYLQKCRTRTTNTDTDMFATTPTQLSTYKRWKDELQQLNASLTSSHWLLLPKGYQFDEGGICSTSGQLQLVYDYYPRLLSSEIALRKKECRRFTQGELWFLLYVLVMSKDSLSLNGEIIGDVHPKNVFLNNSGDIKVGCLRSWPDQVSNYRRAVLEQDSGYLAPEDFQRLRLGAMDNQNNSQAEIFSIGLTLLTTASLQLQHELYNMKGRQFDEQTFFSRLGKFQHDSLYSEIFRAVISNLLEIDPTKRMNLLQLKSFLQKHSENIIAKKPLKIDNVGKKLKNTINIMLKQIRQAKKTIQQPPIQSNNALTMDQIKPAVRNSEQKIMNFINFEEKRLPDLILQLPKTETGIEANLQKNLNINIPPNLNNANVRPPIPPVSYLITMINNEQPHRPTINKTFSSTNITPIITKTSSFTKIESPRKYIPFETLISKGQIQQASPLKQQEPKKLNQQPSLETAKVAQVKQTVQRPNPNEIWLREQTQIGQLNLLMDTKLQGFGLHTLINPKYEPQSVDQPPLLSFHTSHQSKNPHQQQIFEQVKEQQEQYPVQSSQYNKSNISESPSTPISQLQKRQSSQQQVNHSYSSNNQEQLLPGNSAKHSQIQQSSNDIAQQKHKEDQPLKQSEAIESEVSKKSNKIEVVQLQANNQTKPFSPLVKVWGMNMGFNKNKKETNASQAAINIRPVQLNTQKPVLQPRQQKVEKVEAQNLKQQKCFQQQVVAKGLSQIAKASQFKQVDQINKQKSKSDSNFLATQSRKIIEDEYVGNNYILIQDQNKHTINQSRSSQFFNVKSPQQEIKQKKYKIFQYHTYCDIATNGTFEESWQQILVFLRDPTDYSKLIDPKKVKIRINDDRWSLKIGPGVFDILLNKQQGKFLLKNSEGSLCEGEMLGGIFKDQQKNHRLWFNSAYVYNGIKIPSRQIIEQCLNKCKQNIELNSKQ